MINNAKRGIAPCGHSGTYVTPSFVTCDQRCEFSDGIPAHVPPEKTKFLCKRCGSERVRLYAPTQAKDLYACDDCGSLSWP